MGNFHKCVFLGFLFLANSAEALVVCDLNQFSLDQLPTINIYAVTHTEEAYHSFLQKTKSASAVFGIEGAYPNDEEQIAAMFTDWNMKKPKGSLVEGIDMPEIHAMAHLMQTIQLAELELNANNALNASVEIGKFFISTEKYKNLTNAWKRFMDSKLSVYDESTLKLIRLYTGRPTIENAATYKNNSSVEKMISILKTFIKGLWVEVKKSENAKIYEIETMTKIEKDLSVFLKTGLSVPLFNSLVIDARNQFMAREMAKLACRTPRRGYRTVNFFIERRHLNGIMNLFTKHVIGFKRYRRPNVPGPGKEDALVVLMPKT